MNLKFNPKKSTQAGAFLLKANGGQMDKYLWIKMLYLADRKALQRWCESITGDSPASMRYGPILSTIYDLTKGDCLPLRAYWEKFISNADPDANRIELKADPGIDELSPAEVKMLQEVFDNFRDYSFAQMRDYCRRLPEHEDMPEGSSSYLPADKILRAMGKPDKDVLEAERMNHESLVLDKILSGCR